MLLWKSVADESATICGTSATLDYEYVKSRSEHEGFSFMTITLPTYGKDTEKCLDRGYVDRDLYKGFPWQAGLPRFLGGFLDLVFDRSSGVLLDDPSIDAIIAIRQLSLMFGKIALPCSDTRKRAAMKDYIKCEQDVRDSDRRITDQQWSDFRRVGAMLYASLFSSMDREIYDGNIRPKHGPGKTADFLSGNGKYRQLTWPLRLERYFPAMENIIPSPSYWEELDRVDFLEPGAEKPVRVVSVPKTLKTPRIIAIEPTAMQYAQQGIYELFMEQLSTRKNSTSGRVMGTDSLYDFLGFDDQTVNQRLAHKGSLDGSLATLDLSEASDRVSNQHVRELLSNHPHLFGAIDACRSRKADVPGYGVVRLAKFASMGSALCFPMEAMVFLTMIFLGIEQTLNTHLTPKLIKQYRGSVRVYGDDIIVPVSTVPSVVRSLESFGIRVNQSKSFWNGKFRESCGKEYFDGSDVSVVRVRQLFPSRRTDATEVISTVSLRNQLYYAGYWKTCRWLDKTLQGVLRYYPVVLPTSPVLGRHSFLGYKPEMFGDALHNPLVKGYVVVSKPPPDKLEGYGALLKFHLKRGVDPSFDKRHLERSGRPLAVYIKLARASAI
jgi:hypothetical protein